MQVRTSCMPLSLLVLMMIMVSAVSAQQPEFGYSCPNGPQNWDKLSQEWATCREGERQSPIVLIDRLAKRGHTLPLLFNYGTVAVQAVHTGHSVQANIQSGVPTMTLGGTVYELSQFHFHTPSEHWWNGESFPMEMHLVHTDSSGKYGVVAVLLRPGNENEELGKVLNNLPEEGGEPIDIPEFDLSELLPPHLQTFRYSGSLTTPPCTEDVRWFVFAESIGLSYQQIANYQALFSGDEFPDGNARPVRLTYGRAVTLSAPQWK